jgi:hypothetical protein
MCDDFYEILGSFKNEQVDKVMVIFQFPKNVGRLPFAED